MKSMTGYGKGNACSNNLNVTIEMRSVNHKQLDLSIKLPRAFFAFEDLVRKTIQQRVARGHIDLYLNYEVTSIKSADASINMLAVSRYIEMARALECSGVTNDLAFSNVIKLPDVLAQDSNELEESEEVITQLLHQAVTLALDTLIEKRQREGELIKQDFINKISVVCDLVDRIERLSEFTVVDYKQKLQDRIAELIGDTPVNQEKLENEIAFFADKVCIDEELTRLRAHCKNFSIDIQKQTPVGREMDCLLQEMNREANTIGSKANNGGITELIIALKCELEKIREQVQNIE